MVMPMSPREWVVSGYCTLAGIVFLGSWTAIVMRREVFPQARVGELEAGVLQKRTKCVKMCLAILAEGHNRDKE